jgi:hypothetical protein
MAENHETVHRSHDVAITGGADHAWRSAWPYRDGPRFDDVLRFSQNHQHEEECRGVEALGAELVAKLTYYERWIVAFANILFEKGILTPNDVARKMEGVAARLAATPAEQAHSN